MPESETIQLFGKGRWVDEIEKRLSARNFKVVRHQESPYRDAERGLVYKTKVYTDQNFDRFIARFAPRK